MEKQCKEQGAVRAFRSVGRPLDFKAHRRKTSVCVGLGNVRAVLVTRKPNSTPSVAVFSSTRATAWCLDGLGAMSSPCASSQASATRAGVATASAAA
jgi:hypothetical protein